MLKMLKMLWMTHPRSVLKLIGIADLELKDKLTLSYKWNMLRKKAFVFWTNEFHPNVHQIIMMKNCHISFATENVQQVFRNTAKITRTDSSVAQLHSCADMSHN